MVVTITVNSLILLVSFALHKIENKRKEVIKNIASQDDE